MVSDVENTKDVKNAIESLKTNKVRWIHSAFVDMRGLMQDMVISARDYLDGSAFTSGLGFDGSSIRGFKAIEESDMILMPEKDPSHNPLDDG